MPLSQDDIERSKTAVASWRKHAEEFRQDLKREHPETVSTVRIAQLQQYLSEQIESTLTALDACEQLLAEVERLMAEAGKP